MRVSRRPCVSCGVQVPETQAPPYPDHKASCTLVKTWRRSLCTQVIETKVPGWGTVRHLKVWRENGKDGITWDELQVLKNERLGRNTRAIEVYPDQEDLVNSTNMRHLWEVPPGVPLPNLAERG